MKRTASISEAVAHFREGFIARHGTARWAKNRLKAVIAADRAAAPEGRWVRNGKRLGVWPVRFAIGDGPYMLGWVDKARYRYEERR
jgi:hypothetical protein